MAVHCIVPARMGSSRFPGKPLVKILGKEMIVRTLERAVRAECFDRIVCATDSEEIAGVVSRAGFEFVLTGPAATGSDRVSAAAQELGLDLVVNLQGDEPLVEPSVLRDVASALESHPDEWVTVACPLNPAEAELKTVVKVLVKGDYALDFTRSVAVEDASRWFQHQGIYAYSRRCRDEFSSLPQSEVEKERSLEQMRILGKRPIRIVQSPYPSVSVDVPSDVAAVEAALTRAF
ncbi:MAG: 3-deoxy-manno-octulosonate cytidylyltransferase [Fibrobacter sp.]|uniref:3-deoxy-manno-octulosonate cytidylyltransferase n=1 Tax=Fibrobacter sp. TaxID=35828 RepID=UPI002A914943|nr:3-deoxy-manno-octulosonate cytidylyltransferase [Fibrobacter sp.]MDY6264494.1 3-deoxy-manno-octulosonate cytidylyltransferase [Fibrobacter sp.]